MNTYIFFLFAENCMYVPTVWMKYSLSFLDWDIINHPHQFTSSLTHSSFLLPSFCKPKLFKTMIFVAHCETVIQTFLKDYNIRAWISGKDGRIRAQNIEVLLKRIRIARDSCPEKFLVFIKFLLLWNKTPCFLKNSLDFRILLDNFLLSVLLLNKGDSFPILPGIECSLIRKFGT